MITATTPGTAVAFVVSIDLDARMRIGRAHEIAVEHARQVQVVDVIALALREADVLDALALAADAFELLGAGFRGFRYGVHSAASLI